MKSVCIVGAGPAGLAGAKALLQTGHFSVTVFEKGDRIGGIWAVGETSKNGFLNPYTPTNISRFTVGFADLHWGAVELRRSSGGGSTGRSSAHTPTPMFPLAWQVNQYLEEFRRRYIPESVLRLGTEVTKAECDTQQGRPAWNITVRDKSSLETTHRFDYLVLASGFFASPRPLDYNLVLAPTLETKEPLRIIHTSEFRTIEDLIPEPGRVRGRKILIFGGGNSSGETAATLASQLSDAKYSPIARDRRSYEGFKIIQVTPRPLYAVPPLIPADEDCRTFLPLDIKFYDLSKRPDGPIVSNAGELSRGVKDVLHSAVHAMIGGNQSDLGSDALTIPSCEPRSPVYVTLSEAYPEFVRSGAIEVLSGRVSRIEQSGDGTATATIDSGGEESPIGDIAAIIYATGYAASPAVDLLDARSKRALHYDPTSMRIPVILSGYQTYSPEIPSLAFLGFYESPYWTMIELQADLVTTRWLSDQATPSPPFEAPDRLLALRDSMRLRSLSVPQYWFADHLGYLEEAATILGRTRHHGGFAPREGPVPSARYRSASTDHAQADAIMTDIYETWKACTERGKFVARAAFRALQGDWAMRRVINSALPSFPSGRLEGTASFHPRRPTGNETSGEFDFEYLYIESGTLVLSNGAAMPATRRYVYRYSEARDELSVWFVKPDSDLEVDYLFHNLSFVTPDESRKAGAIVAKADHLCVEDMYWTEYRMPVKGVALQEFQTKHTVKGPSKDYVTTTSYRRPEKAEGVAR